MKIPHRIIPQMAQQSPIELPVTHINYHKNHRFVELYLLVHVLPCNFFDWWIILTFSDITSLSGYHMTSTQFMLLTPGIPKYKDPLWAIL